MLPKGKTKVSIVTLQTMLPLLALVPISMVQPPLGDAMTFYGAGLLLGVGYLYFGVHFVLRRSRGTARRLLATSTIYLPLLLAFKIMWR